MKQVIVKDVNTGEEQVFGSAKLAADFLSVSKQALTNAIAKQYKVAEKYTVEIKNNEKVNQNEPKVNQKTEEVNQEISQNEESQPESQPKKKIENLTPTKELKEQKAQMIKITNNKTGVVSKHFLNDLEYLLDLTPEQAKEAVEKGTIWYDHSVELIPFDENYDVAKQKEI